MAKITPVDYDPFAETKGQKLQPVDYDPFAEDMGMIEKLNDLNDKGGEALKYASKKALRYGIEGAAALPAMAANALAGTYNTGADIIRGKGVGARIPDQGSALSKLLTDIGLPQDGTGSERVAGDAARALSGVGAVGKVAEYAGAPIKSLLQSNMGTQAASAITGGMSGGIARESGVGPFGQIASSIIGGVVPVAAFQGISRGAQDSARAIKEATKPFTVSGREQLVGQILKQNASDPDETLKALSNIPKYVPNSPVTTGEAAGDYGLAAMQRGIRNQQGNPFADIESQQNTARNQYLENIAGTKAGIEAAKKSRDVSSGAIREAAFENAKPVKPTEALEEIFKIKKTPGIRSRESVGLAMDWVRSKLLKAKDPRDLYAIRQDINDAMQGKFDSDKPALRLAKSQLKQVKDALDNSIERGAPGFKKYIESYSEQSKPINQQETLQDVQSSIQLNASPDMRSGYPFLSQPKLTGIVKDEAGDLSRTLSDDQINVLNNIEKDLVRSNSLNQRNVRPTGSDTASNLKSSEIVSNFLAERAIDRLPLGLGKILGGMGKEKVQELLIKAFQEPDLARDLLSRIRPELKSTPYSDAMAQKLLAETLGSLTASAQSLKNKQ